VASQSVAASEIIESGADVAGIGEVPRSREPGERRLVAEAVSGS
jgi:hypothetical protein